MTARIINPTRSRIVINEVDAWGYETTDIYTLRDDGTYDHERVVIVPEGLRIPGFDAPDGRAGAA